MIIVTCRTGDKYTQEMEDYIHNQFPNCGHIRYKGEVVELPGVWNKLALFTLPVKEPMLYIDIDTWIRDTDLPELKTDKLMMWSAYWKQPDIHHHYNDVNMKKFKENKNTLINSSVMYWETDQSYIFNKFMKNKEFYINLYKGIDRFIYWEDIDYELLPEEICSSHANPYLGYTNFVTYNGEDYGQYFKSNQQG